MTLPGVWLLIFSCISEGMCVHAKGYTKLYHRRSQLFKALRAGSQTKAVGQKKNAAVIVP